MEGRQAGQCRKVGVKNKLSLGPRGLYPLPLSRRMTNDSWELGEHGKEFY